MNLLVVLPLLFVQTETKTATFTEEAQALAQEYVGAERAMGISIGVIAPSGDMTHFAGETAFASEWCRSDVK